MTLVAVWGRPAYTQDGLVLKPGITCRQLFLAAGISSFSWLFISSWGKPSVRTYAPPSVLYAVGGLFLGMIALHLRTSHNQRLGLGQTDNLGRRRLFFGLGLRGGLLLGVALRANTPRQL